MRILLSPAKKMNRDPDSMPIGGLPALLPKTRQLLDRLNQLSPEEQKGLWQCNETIARLNRERLQAMELDRDLTPAVLSYEGLAYQHMAPGVFSDTAFSYAEKNLRILSGFYGVLRPMDGVRPYRLEMQARLSVGGCKDLYEFWGSSLYETSRDDSGLFVNLASREYSQAVRPYLREGDRMITCIFGERVRGRLVQKATFAKMARGEMVRYLAERSAEEPEAMKQFECLGFHFSEGQSSPDTYVFERDPG